MAVSQKRRTAIVARALLTTQSEAARWGGVSTSSVASWLKDPATLEAAEAVAVHARGDWLSELAEACATAGRALACLAQRHAEPATQLLDDDSAIGPSGEPMTVPERLRASGEAMADLRQVLAAGTETLTHHAALIGDGERRGVVRAA